MKYTAKPSNVEDFFGHIILVANLSDKNEQHEVQKQLNQLCWV